MRRTAALLATAALLLAGCGDDDAETATGTTTTETTVDDATTTTTSQPTTSTTATPVPAELPGERLDIYPYEDAALAVVGVAADDVLNVRAAPGPSFEVVAELGPLEDGVTATGHNRQVGDDQLWVEVDTGAARGWVNGAYVAELGTTDDTTSQLYPEVADRPLADTLVQLGEQVARDTFGRGGEGGTGGPTPRIVVVDGPSVGDLGEITVDVLGFPDDAVLGERLHVFAEAEGGEAFRLRTVEATTLCRRGVADDLCL